MQNKIKAFMATILFVEVLFVTFYFLEYVFAFALGFAVIWFAYGVLKNFYRLSLKYFQEISQ